MSIVKKFCEDNLGALVVSTDGDNTPMRVCGYNEKASRIIVGVENGGWNITSPNDVIITEHSFYRYLPKRGIKIISE